VQVFFFIGRVSEQVGKENVASEGKKKMRETKQNKTRTEEKDLWRHGYTHLSRVVVSDVHRAVLVNPQRPNDYVVNFG